MEFALQHNDDEGKEKYLSARSSFAALWRCQQEMDQVREHMFLRVCGLDSDASSKLSWLSDILEAEIYYGIAT